MKGHYRRVFLAVVTSVLAVSFPLREVTLAGDEKIQESGSERDRSLEEKFGIKTLSMRTSAGGHMLDFRYRVINAGKASPLFSRKIKPYLIDQESGAKLGVPEAPKIGALRQTRKPVADKNYFIIFSNSGKYVKQGSKVTVVIGDFRAENLVVE